MAPYLNFSDQASRTNFVGRSIEIYTILNCPLILVGKEQTVFEFRSEMQPTFRSEMQPTFLFDFINVDFVLFEFFRSSFKD